MIQNNYNLVDFNKFAEEHTTSLCNHIENLVSLQNMNLTKKFDGLVSKYNNLLPKFEKHWIPMGKSIANLYRYAEVSKATNLRYINALPLPVDKITPVKEIEKISKGIEVNGRHISGFNILNSETTKLLETISSSYYVVNEITNKTLKCRIFKEEDFNSIRIRNKTTRLLNKLKSHGIIKK